MLRHVNRNSTEVVRYVRTPKTLRPEKLTSTRTIAPPRLTAMTGPSNTTSFACISSTFDHAFSYWIRRMETWTCNRRINPRREREGGGALLGLLQSRQHYTYIPDTRYHVQSSTAPVYQYDKTQSSVLASSISSPTACCHGYSCIDTIQSRVTFSLFGRMTQCSMTTPNT